MHGCESTEAARESGNQDFNILCFKQPLLILVEELGWVGMKHVCDKREVLLVENTKPVTTTSKCISCLSETLVEFRIFVDVSLTTPSKLCYFSKCLLLLATPDNNPF